MRVALALACVAAAAAGNLTSPCPNPDPAHCSANCDWTNHGKNCGRDVKHYYSAWAQFVTGRNRAGDPPPAWRTTPPLCRAQPGLGGSGALAA